MMAKYKLSIIIPASVLLLFIIVMLFLVSGHFYEEKIIRNNNEQLFQYQKCIKISDNPVIYITSKDTGQKDFYTYMEAQGYKVIKEEQLGSLHLFRNDKNQEIEATLDYTKYYAKWTVQN